MVSIRAAADRISASFDGHIYVNANEQAYHFRAADMQTPVSFDGFIDACVHSDWTSISAKTQGRGQMVQAC